MKRLDDFTEEINKCSKCGLCQAVCPVYKVTKNDCAVSKGKFIMLQGVLNGDLKLNGNINKYLDMCLKCGKCKDFCPSGIDVCKIFESAKYEYVKNNIFGRLIFFLESKWIFGALIGFLKFLSGRKKKISSISDKRGHKILYFKGCAGHIFSYTRNILSNIPNIELIECNFDCCGLPFLSSGNLERFESVKNHNISLIKDSEFDYILTDCASCENTLRSYFKENEYKILSFEELLEILDLRFESKEALKVTFHKPCHMKDESHLMNLLRNIKNVEYIEYNGFDDCCGFGGEFALKNYGLSMAISKEKAQKIMHTNCDAVITTCPGCILGLKKGLITCKNSPAVISLSEFLAKYVIISD